jgi:UDP-N-acetylglucosamine 2-epimerase
MRYFQRQALETTIQTQLSRKTSTNFGSLTEPQRIEIRTKRLNLDAHRLENARKNEIELILKQLDDLTESQQKTFIESLLDETQSILNPYYSTIKDNFSFLFP